MRQTTSVVCLGCGVIPELDGKSRHMRSYSSKRIQELGELAASLLALNAIEYVPLK